MEKGNREEIRDACIHHFDIFCELMQEDGWFDPVHKQLCQWAQKQFFSQLENMEKTGTSDGRLLIIMPRGSLKSTMITKHLTVWVTLYMFYAKKDSGTRSLIAGNTYTNAKKKLRDIRSLFDDTPLFQTLFPEILPKKGRDGNKWSDEGAEINRIGSFGESTFECAGTNTKLTGRHYNLIIEDDTTAPDVDEMKENMTLPSRDTIEKAIGFHKAAHPLFVPKGLRLSIVVSTRWAMEDLVHYVQTGENYKYFNMPAIGKDGERKFSKFYSEDTLAEIKKRIGSFMYSMLYLNEPQDPSTRIFNRELFSYVKGEEVPKMGFFTIAVDPAIAQEDEACDSAITVNQHVAIGPAKHEYWWEDINGKFLPFQLAKKILDVADKYDCEEVPVKGIVIEGNAWQMALKYILLNLMAERKSKGKKSYNIHTFTSGSASGKHLRIRSLQPSFEQKRIHFVSGSLSDQTESQLTQYPNGYLVDTIDSWSMHRKFFGLDQYNIQISDDTPEENTFEEAVLAIKKKLGLHSKGLTEKEVHESEIYGLT